LIDDKKSIIDKFVLAGGFGVHHVGDTEDDMHRTVLTLDSLLEELGYQRYVAP